VDGRLLSERATYEMTGSAEGFVEIDGTRIDLAPETSAAFRNHSWGFQPGRGGPRPYGSPMPSRRADGVRQWVLFRMRDHSGFWFTDPSNRAAAGRGAILRADRVIPVVGAKSNVDFYPGGRRASGGSYRLTDVEGTVRDYRFDDLGWVYCQGGGYFGGFDDGLGQGVYRGEYHEEGEVWDVRDPTTIVDASGHSFRVEHDWAESFTLVRHDDQIGLAHHECVVFGPPRAHAELLDDE